MIGARPGRLTFRRVFPRGLRLLLTLVAVVLVGFYGAASGARQAQSGWGFRHLPVFVNLNPQDVRDRALRAVRAAAQDDGPAARGARAELLRLGGSALPHVLPRLDGLEPRARGRVAFALGPIAVRMRIASADDVASPERALLFFARFWQDRSIEFRAATVRRAVERLAERSLTLRRDDVIHADTYALEALVSALGRVESDADVARVARLHPVLMHITTRGRALPSRPTRDEAAHAVRFWQRLWLEEGADYRVLEGPRRIAALVTETQFGKWIIQAAWWRLGWAEDGTKVTTRVLQALPKSAWHVLLLLLVAVGVAGLGALVDRSPGLSSRVRERVAATAASLVASYPVLLTLALGLELWARQPGVLALCAGALRVGDVNLTMGSLIGLTLLSELLVTLPSTLAATGRAHDELEEA
jgi:peptide/nickel transport system permease protein